VFDFFVEVATFYPMTWRGAYSNTAWYPYRVNDVVTHNGALYVYTHYKPSKVEPSLESAEWTPLASLSTGSSGGGVASFPAPTLNEEKKLTGGAGYYAVNVIYSSIPVSFGVFYYDPSYSSFIPMTVGGAFSYYLQVAPDGALSFKLQTSTIVDGALKNEQSDYTTAANFYTAKLG
jgi:hypothetical protein